MKNFFILFAIFILLQFNPTISYTNITNSAVKQRLNDSLQFFQKLRTSNGLYLDSWFFNVSSQPDIPCSVASIGMGLVALIIQVESQLINESLAHTQLLQTLQLIAGNTNNYTVARNQINGLFRHWINVTTGKQAWQSEYSSIDSAILVSGLLFAKTYYSSDIQIQQLVDQITLPIAWNMTIADPKTGAIYMTYNEDGTGIPSSILVPFNEYMIVAWLAKNDYNQFTKNFAAMDLWQRFFVNPNGSLPVNSYGGYQVLCDNNTWSDGYVSNFVPQFPFYLCNYFSTNSQYLQFVKNAYQADMAWFQKNTTAASYVYGTGAGPLIENAGYQADNFGHNQYKMCSPQILAGFIPLNSTKIFSDYQQLFTNNLGIYELQPGVNIAWRFGANNGEVVNNAAGVDFSTTVFGLAAHNQSLGLGFFQKYNNFLFPFKNSAQNCQAGYYVNSKNSCQICPSNCLQCADLTGECIICPGFISAWLNPNQTTRTCTCPSNQLLVLSPITLNYTCVTLNQANTFYNDQIVANMTANLTQSQLLYLIGGAFGVNGVNASQKLLNILTALNNSQQFILTDRVAMKYTIDALIAITLNNASHQYNIILQIIFLLNNLRIYQAQDALFSQQITELIGLIMQNVMKSDFNLQSTTTQQQTLFYSTLQALCTNVKVQFLKQHTFSENIVYNYHFSNLYSNILSFNSSNLSSVNITSELFNNYFGFSIETSQLQASLPTNSTIYFTQYLFQQFPLTQVESNFTTPANNWVQVMEFFVGPKLTNANTNFNSTAGKASFNFQKESNETNLIYWNSKAMTWDLANSECQTSGQQLICYPNTLAQSSIFTIAQEKTEKIQISIKKIVQNLK